MTPRAFPAIAAIGAALGVAFPAAAERVSVDEAARYEAAVAAFSDACLDSAPGFNAAQNRFSALGYEAPTSDPRVFEKPGEGFAGLGVAGVEGKDAQPNGCLVYAPGMDAAQIAHGFHKAIGAAFDQVQVTRRGADIYWMIGDLGPQRLLAFVAPKSDGPYAQHTLMMIVELPEQ